MRAGSILVDALDENPQALKLPDALSSVYHRGAGELLLAQEAILDGHVAALEGEGVGIPHESSLAQNREGVGIDVRWKGIAHPFDLHIMMANIHA